MTAVDDLKPGMFVAVTRLKQIEESASDPMEFWGHRPQSRVYNGQPLEVLAVSPPFVSVAAQGKVWAFDVRETEVQKLDRRYVRSFEHGTAAIPSAKRKRKKKQKPDPSRCPRCHAGRLIQRLIVKPAGNEWCLACTQCGYQGEVVPA